MQKTKWFSWYERYMMAVGPLSNCMFYIQAYKIFATKTALGISLPAFSIAVIGLSSWLIYGILLKSKVLILSNIIGVLGAIWVLVGIIYYG